MEAKTWTKSSSSNQPGYGKRVQKDSSWQRANVDDVGENWLSDVNVDVQDTSGGLYFNFYYLS